MRIHVIQSRMSFAQADTLQYYLEQCESVISAKIQNRTCLLYTSPSPRDTR